MRPRSLILRRALVGLLWAATAALVLGYAASTVAGFMHVRQFARGANMYILGVGNGELLLGRADGLSSGTVSDTSAWTRWTSRPPGTWSIRGWVEIIRKRGQTSLFIPIWMIVAPALVLSWLVRGWWRTPRVGACAKCGYSLRGLRDNICPECGTQQSEAPA